MRKSFNTEFMAKVALEELEGEKTTAGLSSKISHKALKCHKLCR